MPTSSTAFKDTARPAKGQRGREPTIVIVVFHMMTIVGENSRQKLKQRRKNIFVKMGFYLAISKNDRSI
jgi:hypothetical protein